MTNLYDFLRKIYEQAKADDLNVVQPSDEDLRWLEQFLQAPDVEIHFRAVDTGERIAGDPVMSQNYTIAGDEAQIFSLIVEAALINPRFQKVLRVVLEFIDSHVPTCPACQNRHNEGQKCPPNTAWGFPNN